MEEKFTKADRKQGNPEQGLLSFLELLNNVSVSPDVREFCTPGHKAGRGYGALLMAEQNQVRWERK